MATEDWSANLLKPELKALVNEVFGAIAKNKPNDAFKAMAAAFETIQDPELICVDGQTTASPPFDQVGGYSVNQHIMAMALGSNGRYIREDKFSLDDWDDHIPILIHDLARGDIIEQCIEQIPFEEDARNTLEALHSHTLEKRELLAPVFF